MIEILEYKLVSTCFGIKVMVMVKFYNPNIGMWEFKWRKLRKDEVCDFVNQVKVVK